VGQVRPPSITAPPARRKAARPARATPGSAAPSARSPSAPPAPTPSSPSVTGGSPAAAAKKRAIVATGNTVLTIAYLLSDPDARYTDLGPAFYDSKTGRERHARHLIRQPEHLTGKKVTLNEAA
jgi:hypothetical protein